MENSKAKRDDQIAEIVKAMQTYDLGSSPAWSDLDALSSHTFLDGVEVDPDGIIVRGSEFRGPLSIYVVLQYSEANDDENFKTSDSFMGEFKGHFDKDVPIIDQVTVDTSPFYEGEASQ
jgi:hypothetical protein